MEAIYYGARCGSKIMLSNLNRLSLITGESFIRTRGIYMNKRILRAAFVAGMILLAGCGSKKADFEVDELGDALNTQITYKDELGQLDLQTAAMFINISGIDIVDGVVYEGSGATAEEIVVFKCASDEEAAKAKAVLEERVEEQIESFTDYVPEELTKLNAAVIRVNGEYAVLSVSDDPKSANAIIDEYM